MFVINNRNIFFAISGLLVLASIVTLVPIHVAAQVSTASPYTPPYARWPP